MDVRRRLAVISTILAGLIAIITPLVTLLILPAQASHPVASLSLSGSANADEAAAALERLKARSIVWEGSQYIYFDDFGVLSRVSLRDALHRFEDFDVRQTGYAAYLSAIFRAEGRQYLFFKLPFGASSFSRSGLERSFPGMDARLVVGDATAFNWAALAVFVLLGIALFIGLKRNSIPLFLLPVLAIFASTGALSFALCGIWMLAAVRMYPLFHDWFVSRRLWNVRELLFCSALSLGGTVLVAGASTYPLLVILNGLAVPSTVFLFTRLRLLREDRSGHRRFQPVNLVAKSKRASRIWTWSAVYAAFTVLIAIFPLAAAGSESDYPPALRAFSLERYREHMAMQHEFMTTRLDSGDGTHLKYPLYALEDGMVTSFQEDLQNWELDNVQLPPLEHLSQDLGLSGVVSDGSPARGLARSTPSLPVLAGMLALLLIVPLGAYLSPIRSLGIQNLRKIEGRIAA